jgi:hypothetical protein
MSMDFPPPRLAFALLFSTAIGCNRPTPPSAPAAPAAPVTAATTRPDGSTAARDDWAEGRELFYELIAERTKSTEASTAYWTRVRATDPSAVPTAYLGATTMLASAYEGWPPTKGKLARQGLELLDAAVAAEPANVEVRFLRGMTSYRLPGFFKRGAIAAADLAFVAERATTAAASGALARGQAAAALYHHGLLRADADDLPAARAAWEEAVAIAPDSAPGKAAAVELNKR